MTELTAQQISTRLQRGMTAAECQALIHAISARRAALKSRLDIIENGGTEHRAAMTACDSAQLTVLHREAEVLDDELGMLCDLEARAYQAHVRLIEGEDIEAAHKARKQLSTLTARAATALAAYQAARTQLSDALGYIGSERDRLRRGGDEKAMGAIVVPDADFERIAAALMATGDAREALRRRVCMPDPTLYANTDPDYREQVRDAMVSPFRRGS